MCIYICSSAHAHNAVSVKHTSAHTLLFYTCALGTITKALIWKYHITTYIPSTCTSKDFSCEPKGVLDTHLYTLPWSSVPTLIIAVLEPEMDPDKLLRWIVCEQNGLTWSPLYQLMDVGSRSLEQVQLTVSPTMKSLLLHTTWSPVIDIYLV